MSVLPIPILDLKDKSIFPLNFAISESYAQPKFLSAVDITVGRKSYRGGCSGEPSYSFVVIWNSDYLDSALEKKLQTFFFTTWCLLVAYSSMWIGVQNSKWFLKFIFSVVSVSETLLVLRFKNTSHIYIIFNSWKFDQNCIPICIINTARSNSIRILN